MTDTIGNGMVWLSPTVSVQLKRFPDPSVLGNQDEGYHMWFSYRSGSGERLPDWLRVQPERGTWDLRLKETGIDVSTSGWDSEMIEYPFVFNTRVSACMLYNGNGYGKTGFGIAVLTNV